VSVRGRPTIKEVSKRAGVSVGTVSNALNTPQLVSESTRSRVLEAVGELGYEPNRAARSLARRRTHLVGYRLPDYVEGPNSSLDAFLHYLVTTAAGHDLELVLFTPRKGQDEVDAYHEMIKRGAVDAFILSDTNYYDPRIEFLVAEGFPFASFGRAAADERFSWVDVNGAAGTSQAVNHLAANGHQRIAMVAWPTGSESGDARYQGYLNGMGRAGLEPSHLIRAHNTLDEGRRAFRELWDRSPPPSAVVTVADNLAIGVMLEAAANGVAVAKEISVVGFDDTPMASVIQPPLSSVRQPFERVGEALIDLLVGQLEDPNMEHGGILLDPVLVLRNSTGTYP
jgi:DNA-binding LacI/PurR family transcriptional regulator